MKSILTILLFLSLIKHSFSQDSLKINEIDSMVSLIENKIRQPNSKLFKVGVFFQDWHEQYIIDTLKEELLLVKFYKMSIDTLPRHHAFSEPFFVVDTSIQTLLFYYIDNRLVKILDRIYHENYYPQDSNFIVKTNHGWEISYSIMNKIYWFYSTRFTRHYKELFGRESRFKN